MTLENIFTLKIETLLKQSMLLIANIQMAHMNLIYDHLQQENMKLQIKVQNLTREFCSTVSVRTPPRWTRATTVTLVPTILNHRVAAAAGR